MTRSLQSRLMIWIGGSVAGILLSAGIVLYFMVRVALYHEFDANLRTSCLSYAQLVESDGEEIVSEVGEFRSPALSQSNHAEPYQILDSGGRIIESSPEWADVAVPIDRPGLNQFSIRPWTLPDGRPGRVAAFTFRPRFEGNTETTRPDQGIVPSNGQLKSNSVQRTEPPAGVTLIVARDTVGIGKTLARLQLLIGIVTGVAMIIGLALSVGIARFGLSTLRATATQIGNIDASQLGEPLDVVDVPAELQPIVGALNGLLHRLQRAFERERQFSSNVAHEMRTPLSGLKSTIEVALARKRGADELESTLRDCLRICDQTDGIVNNLLTLARIDAGNVTLQRESFALKQLVDEEWRLLQDRAAERNLSTDFQMTSPVDMKTDKGKLRLVLRNILENAVNYSDANSRISVLCQQQNGQYLIRVANLASRLDRNDIPRLFDRFWRGNKARGQTGEHCGLGLSLCRSLVALLEGTIAAELNEKAELVVTLNLPV